MNKATDAESPTDLAAGVNAKEGTSFPSALGAGDAPPEAKVGHDADLPSLRHLPNLRPEGGGCWGCGRPWGDGWVDCWIPDDVWQLISPNPNGEVDGSGHLCIHCIVTRLNMIGASEVPVSVWAGPFARQAMAPGAQSDFYEGGAA